MTLPPTAIPFSDLCLARSYRDWYTVDHLKTLVSPEEAEQRMEETFQDETDYWLE
jgi:hypothetical protein